MTATLIDASQKWHTYIGDWLMFRSDTNSWTYFEWFQAEPWGINCFFAAQNHENKWYLCYECRLNSYQAELTLTSSILSVLLHPFPFCIYLLCSFVWSLIRKIFMCSCLRALPSIICRYFGWIFFFPKMKQSNWWALKYKWIDAPANIQYIYCKSIQSTPEQIWIILVYNCKKKTKKRFPKCKMSTKQSNVSFLYYLILFLSLWLPFFFIQT